MRALPWVLLFAFVAGCQALPVASPPPPGLDPTARAPRGEGPAPAPADAAACAPLDVSSLEPAAPSPDGRTIALADVFPREEPRAGGEVARSVDVGVVTYDRVERGDPGGALGYGMGWEGVSKRWPLDALRPEVAARFDRWLAAWSRIADAQREGYLLGRRTNRLVAAPPPDGGRSLACALRQKSDADARIAAATSEATREAGELTSLLEGAADETPAERFLLAYLSTDGVKARPEGEERATTERATSLLKRVAEDRAAPVELRARAFEQIAKLAQKLGQTERVVDALGRALATTRDPDLAIETRIKLATLADDPRKREALLADVVKALDQAPAGASRDPGAYRLAEALGDLSALELARGAFERARDDAARCAREVAYDFADDADPWGCAPTLATALAALGGGTKDIQVPLRFLSPLALALAEASRATFDRDEARRAGELALARLPEAKEAPAIAAWIASTSPSAADASTATRRALVDPRSTWTLAQRARLAEEDAPRVDAELASLVKPPAPLFPPPPPDESALSDELAARVRRAAETCRDAVAKVRGDISLRVDTTGPVAKVNVRGVDGAGARCLRTRGPSFFRSLGPTVVTAALRGE